MEGIIRVRVRGVYATALTKILLDEGFQIVQASALISSRFGIPQVPAPADVTVKSVESEPSRLLVIGYPEKTEKVAETLRRYIAHSPWWRSKLDLYSTVVARVTRSEGQRCIASVDGVELEVVNGIECREGELIVGWVVKAPIFPGEVGRLVPGVRVVGDYAMLYKSKSPHVTISEHIREASRRALLSSMALDYTKDGIGVHWRSSARDAEESVLREELGRLREELGKVEEKAKELISRGKTGVVSIGERLYITELSSVDKKRLDEIRSEVLPTMPLHHTIKSLGDERLNTIIDFAEYVLARDNKLVGQLYEGLLDYIVSMMQGKRVKIEHVKLDGRVIELGQGIVREVRRKGEGLIVIVERHVKTYGVYDGLGVSKEPGDVIESWFDTREWYVKHVYRSREGEIKGEYININTPPEILPGRIRYIDLSVDIVKRSDGSIEVIDVDELRAYIEAGIVPETVVDRIREVVRSIAGVELQL